jgi:16S rRNA (cytidine1402-2'-O)-methyltransferase
MLYIVSTPIGNLGDITLRALDILRSVECVVSEDTRKTGFMLKHFDISKPQISFYEGNEKKHLPRILGLLAAGKDVALVSNAGTPAVSDPGFTLVRAALENDFEISAVPGPTALIMALVLSGLPVHSFTFRGFPPRKTGARQRFLSVDEESPHTLIFYESPHRLIAFLEDALSAYGDRLAAVANDLTKKFESVLRGKLSELTEQLKTQKLLGEYTIVIAGKIKDRKTK